MPKAKKMVARRRRYRPGNALSLYGMMDALTGIASIPKVRQGLQKMVDDEWIWNQLEKIQHFQKEQQAVIEGLRKRMAKLK